MQLLAPGSKRAPDKFILNDNGYNTIIACNKLKLVYDFIIYFS